MHEQWQSFWLAEGMWPVLWAVWAVIVFYFISRTERAPGYGDDPGQSGLLRHHDTQDVGEERTP